jgi:1-acyl-sn-glycerol-3-phosphate acyltransferase
MAYRLLSPLTHANAGQWCHVFPEGGVWQNDTLGGRDITATGISTSSVVSSNSADDAFTASAGAVPLQDTDVLSNTSDGPVAAVTSQRKLPIMDRLKWGIGKLIAHAPTKPVVIPFFFMGTETIYPQDKVTKALRNKLPIPGCNVDIRFGPEIDFSGLIAEHEKLYGPLWKVKPSVKHEQKNEDGSDVDFHTYWDSKPSDYILYAKIAKRVEESLVELNQHYDAEKRSRDRAEL